MGGAETAITGLGIVKSNLTLLVIPCTPSTYAPSLASLYIGRLERCTSLLSLHIIQSEEFRQWWYHVRNIEQKVAVGT